MMLDSSFMLHTLADAAVSRGWGTEHSCTEEAAGICKTSSTVSGINCAPSTSSQACVTTAWTAGEHQEELVILSGEELTICTEADEVTTTTVSHPTVSLYPTVSPFSYAPRKKGAEIPARKHGAQKSLPPEEPSPHKQKALPCCTSPPDAVEESPPTTQAPNEQPADGALADPPSSSDPKTSTGKKQVIEGKFKPFKGISFTTVYSSPALEKSVWDQIFLRGSNVDLPDEDVWDSNEGFQIPSEFTYSTRLSQCSQKEDASIRKLRFKKHSKTKKSKIKSFQCTLCEYSSPSRSNLKRHAMVNHSENKPFKCSLCEYASADASNFKMHKMVKHSKLRPSRCAQCEFSCATRSQLRKHVMAKHSSVRPFQCSECPFSTVYSCGLKKHTLSQHSGIRAFQCSLCDYASARKDKLRSHIKAKHPDL
ncbi:Zinc finger C2H2-type [Trinorchestia longiramus]|nr:Zinc finger C2H2-type [Trinorchestia longiramus]